MEYIALKLLEEHTQRLVDSLATGNENAVVMRLEMVKKYLETLRAIRAVDEATDVGDKGSVASLPNPLIRK